ncbi:hypothetical protein Poli38472_012888 [Pythium oligandrum]|uniref:Cyclic nucleotide-binding domain-containing protein n=1 Tax=Pythium oligandrum TaxID=41045 RepID=A0A8K1CIL3_PYTOL|nr:hypothetical protein Poli38472_012888 [Pythium oligandrum]|eukprot:TMW64266.1 hypothetical protein Poli38472_012888 [Pythium oligandrum]
MASPAPSRPPTRLSVITTAEGGTGSTSTPTTPRTPRRESKDQLARGVRKPVKPSSTASGAASNNGTENTLITAAALSSATSASMEHASDAHSKPKIALSKRWGLIRKEVMPNPGLMKINERVLQIIQTLRKPPEDRSENDIKLLYTWLMNQEKISSLFTTMSEVSAKKLCKEMEFLHLKAGDVVVNQGDKGNTCFILLSGLVSVHVRSADDQKKYHRVTRASLDGTSSRQLVDQGLITFGPKVVSLTPGATFGELCLIEPDSKRSATVLVDESAQVANFIVLTAASYLRMTRSQTIEGTITDHMAFLQHTLLFRKWTKMQLMHLVNSMKLLTVPAGQFITRKGMDADSFYLILRGEAHECLRLVLNENSEVSMDENRGVQHCITVELTYLGKFDVAGEYLAAEKKIVVCPIDIRAVSDVDCLVLSRKLFNLHFGGKDMKPHALRAFNRLRSIGTQREMWRETRLNQALQYPNFRVPITRKLMRLSGNICMTCGRDTHVAGDELCMELTTYRMEDEKRKKLEQQRETRTRSRHRISVRPTQTQVSTAAKRAQQDKNKHLPSLNEDDEDDDSDHLSEEDELETRKNKDDDDTAERMSKRLGLRLVRKQWRAARQAGLLAPAPQRPATTPAESPTTSPHTRLLRITSVTRSMHLSRRRLLEGEQKERTVEIEREIQRIRDAWPYNWKDLETHSDEDEANLPRYEILYRNMPRSPRQTATPASRPDQTPTKLSTTRRPHTVR